MKCGTATGPVAFCLYAAAHCSKCVGAPVQSETTEISLFGGKSSLKNFLTGFSIEAATCIAHRKANHFPVVDQFLTSIKRDPPNACVTAFDRLIGVQNQVTHHLQQAYPVRADTQCADAGLKT